jgi:hypothetical protein
VVETEKEKERGKKEETKEQEKEKFTIEPSSDRYLASNLPMSCAMLESGFCRTVSFTAARISHRFTSAPLAVMFLEEEGGDGGRKRRGRRVGEGKGTQGGGRREGREKPLSKRGWGKESYLATLLRAPSSPPAIFRNVSKFERICSCCASITPAMVLPPTGSRFCLISVACCSWCLAPACCL